MVRILPAQRVAEHRSGAKNDRNDAYAILRAGRDIGIKAVPVKSSQALAMQALHRIRQGYMRRKTAVSNQMRGLLLEHDIALVKGDTTIMQWIPRIIRDASRPVPELLRDLLSDLLAEFEHLRMRIEAMNGKLRASARQFAAYFGSVPDQHSSGQKVRLGKMSKRGDAYLRSMMIEGTHAVLRHVSPNSQDSDDKRLLGWIHRHGRKGAAIRLANRNFRIAWVLLQNDQNYSRNPNRQTEVSESQGNRI